MTLYLGNTPIAGGGTADQTYDGTSTNAQSGTAVAGLLEAIYPVGSLYIGTQATCPMSTVMSGTTWTLVSAGYALWTGNGQSGSGTTTNANYANAKANTTIAAGLPDHKHTVSKQYGTTDQASGDGIAGTSHNVGTMNMTCGNASANNSIYGKSTTVQPPAYVVNVWRRTAQGVKMEKYAKIIDEKTKQVQVGVGCSDNFYIEIGMTPMEVEQAYNGDWYIEGYAPPKPEPTPEEKRQEEISDLKGYLQHTDYVVLKIAEGVATPEQYAETLQKRQEARERLRELGA